MTEVVNLLERCRNWVLVTFNSYFGCLYAYFGFLEIVLLTFDPLRRSIQIDLSAYRAFMSDISIWECIPKKPVWSTRLPSRTSARVKLTRSRV